MNGIVYMVTSGDYIEALAVSAASLRRHYSGDVTLFFTESADSVSLADLCCNYAMTRRRMPEPHTFPHIAKFKSHRMPWLSKSYVASVASYRYAVYLDADTVVDHSIDDLFGHDLAFTSPEQNRLNDKQHHGSRNVRGHLRRIRRTYPHLAPLVNETLRANPLCINNGVFSFSPSSLKVHAWFYLSMACAVMEYNDEVTALLTFGGNMDMLGPEWHGLAPNLMSEVAIRHFTDRSWQTKSKWPEAHAAWQQAKSQLMETIQI